MTEATPDYITVQHVPGTTKHVIRHMRWDSRADGYQVHTEGKPLTLFEARILARGLAQGLGLEYRL